MKFEMLLPVILFVCSCPRFSLSQILGEEAIYTVNGKKALHTVSEKFLSISIDPAVLLAGLNLSDASLELARHLSPAYIRVAGPSTQFVKYVDFDEKLSEHSSEDPANVVVTPPMWFGINEWLTLANLTPVFGINDLETTKGLWNPKSTMPLLELSDKLNVTCYWQLGYDCSNKTLTQYREDLVILRHILDAFPDKRNNWEVIGSDLSKCITNKNTENARKILEELEKTTAAVILEPSTPNYLDNSISKLISSPLRPKTPVWVTAPKVSHHINFSSALSWATQIGEAARIGYEVIFRQPRLHEIFSETPVYWVSMLHKALMGRTVLEIRENSMGLNPQVSLFAHCTRHQNNFIRSGAMTVLMVNNGTLNHTIYLRFGTIMIKNAEVQSYVLTSPEQDSADVLLNGEKLTMGKFQGDKMDVLPKLRRARIMNYLSLTLPPKSIGFFVLPDAQLPICVNKENEMELLMDEIAQDQNIRLSGEVSVELSPRFGLHKAPTLRQLQERMQKEMESDERFFKNAHKKIKKSPAKHEIAPKNDMLEQSRNYFIERAKLAEKQRKQLDNEHKRGDLRQLLKEKHKETERVFKEPAKEFELELTSAEIRKILADRAKAKAAKKNIIFTSEELEEIMNKATEKFLKNRNTHIKISRKHKRETRNKKDINMRLLKLKSLGERRRLMKIHEHSFNKTKNAKNRNKRDINMDLLKLKAESLLKMSKKEAETTKSFRYTENKQATIKDSWGSDESNPVQEDIYPEIAESDEESTEKPLKKKQFKHKINKPSFSIPKPAKPVKNHKYHKETPPIIEPEFELVDPETDEEEEDFSLTSENVGIHEFFGTESGEKLKKNVSELWEIGENPVEEKNEDNHLPALETRGFAVTEDAEKNVEQDDVSFGDEYDDLDSDEENPIRFKRNAPKTISREGKYYFKFRKNPDKIKIDENLKNQQFKLLRQRLTQKKLMEKQAIKKRSVENNVNLFNQRYKSLTENLKIWQPSDIVGLKKNHWVRSIQDKKRNERSVNKIESIENAIDSIIGPKLNLEDGDYQLIFPNNDKIEVLEKNGDTDVKFVLHSSENSNKSEVKESHVQKISNRTSDNVWNKIFKDVTEFFKEITDNLKGYLVKNILRN